MNSFKDEESAELTTNTYADQCATTENIFNQKVAEIVKLKETNVESLSSEGRLVDSVANAELLSVTDKFDAILMESARVKRTFVETLQQASIVYQARRKLVLTHGVGSRK